MLEVVAAVIEREGMYLIARRAPGKSQAGKWEFPGGKVEFGESYSSALTREIKEESGIELRVGDLLCSAEHAYEDMSIRLVALTATCSEDITGSTDHDCIVWVEPDNLEKYDFDDVVPSNCTVSGAVPLVGLATNAAVGALLPPPPHAASSSAVAANVSHHSVVTFMATT